jgi:hypothetical protein
MIWTLPLHSDVMRAYAWNSALRGRRVLIRNARALVILDTRPAQVRASVTA